MNKDLIKLLKELEEQIKFNYTSGVQELMQEISILVGIEYQEDYVEWRKSLIEVCQGG